MNILKRYVLGEVLRAFLLSLLTMTAIFVLFMVAAEAMRSKLLTPSDVLELVPYVVPSTLPYTMPVSLLFAVTVVYGRIAGDNEVIAVKSAGLNVVTTLILPTILLATVLSAFLFHVSRGWIPRSAHKAKLVLFKNAEDTFYKFLKRDRQFDNVKWPFLIKVRDVEGRTMIDPTFKKRARSKDNGETFSMTIQAKSAELRFDPVAKLVRVHLEQAEVVNYSKDDEIMLIDNNTLEIPMPSESSFIIQKAIQECPNDEINAELAKSRKSIASDRLRQAITVGFQFASGRFDTIKWQEVQRAVDEHAYSQARCHALDTEKQLRMSMACGSLLFVLLGAPVGILFAKRDFLSAFMTCFLPIIGAYYPFMLLGVNLGKEGQLPPEIALWIGNGILAIGAALVYPRIIKF